MKHTSIFASKTIWSFLLHLFLVTLPVTGGIAWFYFSYYSKGLCHREQIHPGMTKRDLANVGMMATDFAYWDIFEVPDTDLVTMCNIDEPKPADSLTIWIVGDSYTLQGIGSFQNFMAHALPPEYKVVTVYRDLDCLLSPLDVFVDLVEREPYPSRVILFTGGRHTVSRLNDLTLDTVPDFYHAVQNLEVIEGYKPKGFLELCQEYYKKHLGIQNTTKRARLSMPLFSYKGAENELLFYDHDLWTYSDEQVAAASDKLDSLFAFAERKGIDLYFVSGAGKYEMYQPFIVKNKYPKIDNVERLKAVNHQPHFIYTNEVLLPLVEQGEKDMYYYDDTHWSPKGAKVFGEYLAKRILE